ncbi:hypothetical protein [Thermoplasma volcanium GSS1]|uniref:Cas12f1-like TNB domain-containing protein n=1 Tax=Thermoplasma volcanium (strain ATCC 51530 / DSM 4299 / JCM 9571 / NBRC 15438 / GSS1) TaxID=273116 RepID=Q97A87_THEVO|nr:zinc ribbon domain-containing protein [Thermoplasma volcanium]BAB60065.1 hypothetical protein [Thermoplasma volcanium GSS1]
MGPAKKKKKGKEKKFRRELGSWSAVELEKFIEYKAEDAGKKVIYINPKYSPQKCSRCGYVSKENRHDSVFKCKNCGFELNADLNASRNIEVIRVSEYFRLLSASQSLLFNETPLTGGAGDQRQAPKL